MSPRGAESVSMSGGGMSMSAVPLSMSSGPLSMLGVPLSMSPRIPSMPASRASMRDRPDHVRGPRQTAITAAVTIAVRRADDLRALVAPTAPIAPRLVPRFVHRAQPHGKTPAPTVLACARQALPGSGQAMSYAPGGRFLPD